MVSYKRQEYSESINYFNSIQVKNTQYCYCDMLLYRCLAYCKNDQPELAQHDQDLYFKNNCNKDTAFDLELCSTGFNGPKDH